MEPKMLRVIISVLCCVSLSVALNIKPVFRETPEIVNILNDMRNELDNVKLINERYGERIMYLEKQVNECNMKYMYTELTKKESNEPQIMEQLSHIEHQMEANYKNVLDRLDALETQRDGEYGRSDIAISKSDVEDEFHVEFDSDQDSVEMELTGTNERLSSINKRIIPVTRHNGIAFTAFLRIPNNTQDDPRSQFKLQVPVGSILPFDNVELNEGHGFDSTTHVFTCPVSGIYYFSHSIAASSHIVTEMVRNGAPLVQLVGRGHDSQGSHPVVTICNEGDEVFVRLSNMSHDDFIDFHNLEHDCNEQQCNFDKVISFSGYQLW